MQSVERDLSDKRERHHGNPAPDPDTFEALDLRRRQFAETPFTSNDHLPAQHPAEQGAIGGVLQNGGNVDGGKKIRNDDKSGNDQHPVEERKAPLRSPPGFPSSA